MPNLTPKEVSSFVSFKQDDMDWEYVDGVVDMPNLQAEGVSGILKRLSNFGVALLGDEVGTGKTFQALTVASLFLRENPNARVLVLTPRQTVAEQWPSEFSTLRNKHFKEKILQNIEIPVLNRMHSLDNGRKGKKNPGQNPDVDWRKGGKELKEHKKLNKERLIIGKFSSFSYLKQGGKGEGKISEQEFKNRIDLISSTLGIGSFDLVIIDESHYFRNANSNRYEAAQTVFSRTSENCKFLLMTATPNHSSKEDLITSLMVTGKLKEKSTETGLGYFWRNGSEEVFLGDSSNTSETLNKIAVRRFRRLSSKGLSKHNYRKGKAIEATFKNNPDSEIFFAMYQRAVTQILEKQSKKSKSALKKFLEGMEFDPQKYDSGQIEDSEEESREASASNNSGDYKKGEDAFILKKLIETYQKTIGGGQEARPSNPKYEAAVDEIWESIWPKDPSIEPEKVLVFTRRIASTKEISSQIIAKMDEELWKMILRSAGESESEPMPRNRNDFAEYLEIMLGGNPLDKELTEKSDEGSKNEEEPQREGQGEGEGEDKLPSESLVLKFFKKENPSALTADNKKEKKTPGSSFKRIFEKGRSQFSQFFESNPSIGGLIDLIEIPENLKSETDNILHALHKAILHASTGVVEMFCIYMESDHSYADFFSRLQKKWDKGQLRFKLEVQTFVAQYSVFYEKFLSEEDKNSAKGADGTSRMSWNMFNNASPAYPYTGDTKNTSVIRRFNSPFFPKVLVSTSVLQEGVNLQLNCRKILHYGHAFTAGDDEQRTGRVDRIFGKIERELEEKEGATLDVLYPYLGSTHDENDLRNFLKKREELLSLIDNLEMETGVDMDEFTNGMKIEDFLPCPDKKKGSEDPFPA